MALLLILAMGLSMVACVATPPAPTPDPGPQPSTPTYRVTLYVDGATIEGASYVDVESGGTATFQVKLNEGYILSNLTDGCTYDAKTGVLTVPDVTRNTIVTLNAIENVYTGSCYYFFRGANGDTSTAPSESEVALGTTVTVSAGDTSRSFVGWSYTRGGAIVSSARSYTFVLTPELLTESGDFYIYSNYRDSNIFYYNANGGTINEGTTNFKGNSFMKVEKTSNAELKITMAAKYLDFCACATAFWNDGTFTRDGYVLKEFNTAADGSGEPYSPGSKVLQMAEGESKFTLYCIWEPYNVSDFTYDPYEMKNPVDAKKAPHWNEKGWIITGYKGDAKTVAIPDRIDGTPVIAVKAGAFVNKKVETLVLPHTMQGMQDGSISGCSSLTTLYYPNAIYYINNEVLDEASYTNLKNFIVYASMAPRYTTNNGDFAIKLSRLMATQTDNRIVFVAGSSSYQGLATEYLQDLLDNEYVVVNFGTTRTTHGSLYLEGIQHYLHEGDIVIFAPENSTYMMGDTRLYWKTLRDMDGMNNLFRYVDISNYSNIFGAFRDLNRGTKGTAYEQACPSTYQRTPQNYEEVCTITGMNKYGDDVKGAKNGYVNTSVTKYSDVYTITMNEYFKNTNEGRWENAGSQKDYTDETFWTAVNTGSHKQQLQRVSAVVKATGARIYFGYCPIDGSSIIQESRTAQALAAYDKMMREEFGFDGTLGTAADFIFAREYFFDCAFHTNNYGRTWRTYYAYVAFCEMFGKEVKYTNGDLGENYQGCLFEKGEDGKFLTAPKFSVDYLK